nr:CCR4-NOT transcription complex subunit 1-like [Ipomoea batatas]
MPKLLAGNAQNGWPYFHRLLVDLLQFMEPFLRNAELGEAPVCLLYEETLRVLLIILNDFPEFLCDYHFSFCDVIPSTCIQMRNMVLSACPRNMNLPNPSAPGVKIDLLPEIKLSPRILSEVDAALKTRQLKHDVDEYLKTRQQGSLFLRELKQTLLLSPSEAARAGTHYNVPLINSLVLYVGILAVQQRQMTTRTATSNNNSNSQVLLLANSAPNPSTVLDAAFDIFKTLCMELDKEGRYVLLNAIANQLRYPNNHTHYFSLTILYLFANSNQEMIQEQIIRVILERLVAKPPHPWGLVVTFIELTRVDKIQNQKETGEGRVFVVKQARYFLGFSTEVQFAHDMKNSNKCYEANAHDEHDIGRNLQSRSIISVKLEHSTARPSSCSTTGTSSCGPPATHVGSCSCSSSSLRTSSQRHFCTHPPTISKVKNSLVIFM